MKNHLRNGLLAALLAVTLVACDTTEDEDPTLTGRWTLIKVEDNTGDKTASFREQGTLGLEFTAAEYIISFDAVDDADDTTVRGGYSADEAQGRLRLQVSIAGIPIPALSVPYEFVGENLQVTFDGLILDQILDAGLKGTVKLTFRKASGS